MSNQWDELEDGEIRDDDNEQEFTNNFQQAENQNSQDTSTPEFENIQLEIGAEVQVIENESNFGEIQDSPDVEDSQIDLTFGRALIQNENL